MLLINLIAARRAERRKREMVRAVIVRGMAAVGAATVLAIAFMTWSTQITESRIRDADAQMVLLKDTVDQVERLQSSLESLQPRVETLVKAQNATNRWRAVLAEVGASLPEQTWITSFASQNTAGQGFTVTGQTVSQDRVGKAMMRLHRADIVQSVDLRFSRSGQGSQMVTFELAGAMLPEEGAANAN
jgi:Tfp pilus assembly protein PilN